MFTVWTTRLSPSPRAAPPSPVQSHSRSAPRRGVCGGGERRSRGRAGRGRMEMQEERGGFGGAES